MTSPTPSVFESSSSLAFEIAEMDPKFLAKACAAVGPTCLIESET